MKDVFAIVDEEIKVDAMIEMTIRNFYNIILVLAKILNDNDIIDFLIEVFDERR